MTETVDVAIPGFIGLVMSLWPRLFFAGSRKSLMPPISCIHFLRLKPAGKAIPKGRKAKGSTRQNQRRKTGVAISAPKTPANKSIRYFITKQILGSIGLRVK